MLFSLLLSYLSQKKPVSILYLNFNVCVLLQMTTFTETAEMLDIKFKSIKEVGQEGFGLKRMLMDAMEQKQRLMKSQLSSLKAKYGVQVCEVSLRHMFTVIAVINYLILWSFCLS